MKQALSEGRAVPTKIQQAPELKTENAFLWMAFVDLSGERHYEMGPIPRSVVRDYAWEYDFDPEFLYHVISRVDDWYLKYHAKKMEASAKKGRK